MRIALRFVEEAYRAPSDNKLSRFAQLALGEFRADVGAWPDFCAQMLKVHLPYCCHFRAFQLVDLHVVLVD